MDSIQLGVSVVSGGLAGGCVSALSNRIFHWRTLRTQFHPKLNDIFGEYVIRMEKPEGRYWASRVGYPPSPEDEKFVDRRTEFVTNLPQFNELREARELRRALITDLNPNHAGTGTEIKTDLMPEHTAISRCLDIVQKKLKL